jgi:hypothetical protein
MIKNIPIGIYEDVKKELYERFTKLKWNPHYPEKANIDVNDDEMVQVHVKKVIK